MRKIAIFGGSFNPIHTAHVALARTIREQCGLDEVWFLVSPHNPLKQSSGLMDENDRLRMVQLALNDEPGLVASDYEFHLPRPSYTWNTLQSLSSEHPDYTLYIIIGADNWALFPRWAHHEDIIRNYRIIVYPREGYDINPSTLPPTVQLVQTPLINITSTQIRELIAKGEEYKHLVHPAVAEYIEKYIK